MYSYKVYVEGPLGYKAISLVSANSALEAEAMALRYFQALDPRVRVSRTECVSRPSAPIVAAPLSSIHNVIAVDFIKRRRVINL